MDWIFDFWTPDAFPEVMATTGAMLIGRGTYEVAKQMPDEERTYEGGAEFVLTHEPDKPDPNVTFLTCDIAEAVATALSAAGGKNLEILGADLASQCLQRGLVDEILVYVLPVLLGDGVRFSSRPSTGSTSNHSATPSRAPSPCPLPCASRLQRALGNPRRSEVSARSVIVPGPLGFCVGGSRLCRGGRVLTRLALRAKSEGLWPAPGSGPGSSGPRTEEYRRGR